jgi:D-3-phosphoglycerate dehydrogenase/C-terminal binding protein
VQRADTLKELLTQSNVLSIHCPATPETVRLIGAEQIALLPRGSFLINTARGPIVDTSAIPDAIRSGQLAGAGLDVLPIEPPPENDPLVAAGRDPRHPCHDRVVITPHAAFYSE